jgi:hypothetical protein
MSINKYAEMLTPVKLISHFKHLTLVQMASLLRAICSLDNFNLTVLYQEHTSLMTTVYFNFSAHDQESNLIDQH